MNELLLQEMQSIWQQWLKRQDYRPRDSQWQMIEHLAAGLSEVAGGEGSEGNRCSAIEAPTGTGKTIAYLIAALAVAKRRNCKLVISTSTIALQNQLLEGELPQLQQFYDFSYALLKGRQHYACNARLEQFCSSAADADSEREGQQQLVVEQLPEIKAATAAKFHKLKEMLDTGRWDGDRSTLDGDISLQNSQWRQLTVTSAQCQGKKCRFYDNCSLFAARRRAWKVDCIITNHSLLMADIALGGGVLLPAPGETIYVCDEAHMLGHQAREFFSLRSRPKERLRFAEQLEQLLGYLVDSGKASRNLRRILDDVGRQLHQLKSSLTEAQSGILSYCRRERHLKGDGELSLRFSRGVVPPELCELASRVAECLFVLTVQLERIAKTFEAERGQAEAGQIVDDAGDSPLSGRQFMVATLRERCENELALWQRYAEPDPEDSIPWARWVDSSDSGQQLGLYACPVSAAPFLTENFWDKCLAAVLTSATLSVNGTFSRLQSDLGLPANSSMHILPPVFDYLNAAELWVPDDLCNPRNSEQHTREVTGALRQLLDESAANLVIFASVQQLQNVVAGLRREAPELPILVQGEGEITQLIRQHRRRIDRGQNSSLIGLISMAEGLDLAGDYCTQVIVAKLGFASPDEPVAATLAEWIKARGGNPFEEIALPDTALRLKQATGRLLRSETDRGRIVVLDSRLLTARYGEILINSLPPFRLSTGAVFTSGTY